MKGMINLSFGFHSVARGPSDLVIKKWGMILLESATSMWVSDSDKWPAEGLSQYDPGC